MALSVGLFGALIGSFLNVVIWRLPRGESLAFPGSHCPSCGVSLGARDNVPVLSWLVLRGRCRGCATTISARYPLVETLTALVFAAVVLARGFDLSLALLLPFAAMLLAVGFIDLEHRIVPNRIVGPAALYAIAGTALVDLDRLPTALIAGAAAFAFFLLAALAYPGGMGMGDVKLAGVMGLFLGLSVIPALLVAFLAGTVVGLVIIARHGPEARKHGVPFAPFLALGGLVALFAGPQLVDLYVTSFLR